MAYNKELGDLNRRKYAKPPSWEQIDAFVQEMGMNIYHFERFYGLPFNTLAKVKGGSKNLGSPYWHIIYEKIKPAYGAGFIGDYLPNQPQNRRKTFIPNTVPTREDKDAHTRLVRVSKATD